MDDQGSTERLDRRVLALKGGLLAAWAAVSFGAIFFARDLQFSLGPWPFSYWFAAQTASRPPFSASTRRSSRSVDPWSSMGRHHRTGPPRDP